MNELQKFTAFGVGVAIDENNNAYMEAEIVARGFGFVQTKNGIEYVRWERVNEYLKSFGYSPSVGKGDYIPESYVYRLGFKADNEVGKAFQSLLADKVIPEIRKHGYYQVNTAANNVKTIRAEAMLNNSKVRQANVVLQCAKLTKVDLHRETLIGIATNLVTGKELMALPPVEKMYTATEVGNQLGISANKVGKIANKLEIKAESGQENEYGCWVSDVAKGNNNKQVQSWRYYQAGIDAIKEHLKTNN